MVSPNTVEPLILEKQQLQNCAIEKHKFLKGIQVEIFFCLVSSQKNFTNPKNFTKFELYTTFCSQDKTI